MVSLRNRGTAWHRDRHNLCLKNAPSRCAVAPSLTARFQRGTAHRRRLDTQFNGRRPAVLLEERHRDDPGAPAGLACKQLEADAAAVIDAAIATVTGMPAVTAAFSPGHSYSSSNGIRSSTLASVTASHSPAGPY